MLGVDYSFARPDPATIKATGYDFAVRYISPPPNGKNISPDEAQGILGAGLGLVLVWETYEQAASRTGYAGGQAEGAQAIRMAQAIGYPAGCTIYFVLEDPRRINSSLYPAAAQYARGVKDLGGPYVIGGYGSQDLMEYALGQGVIDMGWQVEGWSHSVSPSCHLYQRSNGREHELDGTDEDVALQPTFGAWFANAAPSPAPPTQGEPDDMPKLTLIARDSDPGSIWINYGDCFRTHVPTMDLMHLYQFLGAQGPITIRGDWFDNMTDTATLAGGGGAPGQPAPTHFVGTIDMHST